MAVYRTNPEPKAQPEPQPQPAPEPAPSNPANEPAPQPEQRHLPVAAPNPNEDEFGDPKPQPGFTMPSIKMPNLDGVRNWFGGGFGNLLDDIVVALGSDSVYVASRDQPEPAAFGAYVALTKANQQIFALGDKARAMLGREPQNIEVVPLLRHGVPENPDLFAQFLQRVLKKHFKASQLVRPRILCSGNFYSPLLKQVCSEGLFQIRSRDILFCEPEIAGAVGMGLDILEPDLKTVLVFERDWMGFMVMSMTGSLTRIRLNIGFDDLLEDIQIYFEESSDFSPREDDLIQQFRQQGFTGSQNLIGWEAWVDQVERGKPVTIEADSQVYQKAVTPTLLRIKHAVNKSLQDLTREQRYTVQTTSTYLAGEYAELPGFKELLEKVFNREFKLAENPRPNHGHGIGEFDPTDRGPSRHQRRRRNG